MVVGKFDQVWRAWFSEKSYSTLSRLVSSSVARNAVVACATAAVFAPPGLAPLVLRLTAVNVCPPPPPGAPWAPVGLEADADAEADVEDEVESVELQPVATER